jgi:hypothetical protein
MTPYARRRMSSDDPVVAALAEVARHLFPTIYAPPVDVSGNPLRNPEALQASYNVGRSAPGQQVLEAMRGDPVLFELLTPPPDAEETADGWVWGAMIEENTGNAWRRWTFELPGLVVESAARNVLATGGSTETVEPIIAELPGILDEMRRLISGQPVLAWAGAAFAGLRLPEGTRVETPFGVLRCAAEPERSHRPGGSPEPWTILEAAFPLTWKLGERVEGDALVISEAFTEAQMGLTRLPLAGLLALGQDAVPRMTWFYVRAPLRNWGPAGWPVAPLWTGESGQEPGSLQPGRVTELADWCRLVDDHRQPSIAIAERRVLSAIGDRPHSAEDALIDAVIAWENLFGHGGNVEMTFRVTTALAILLEPDVTRRPDLAKELRGIYGDRSKVAHGGTLGGGHDLAGERDRAIDVAVKALRTLFREHPDLLADRDRGMRLLLAGVPTGASGEA